MTVAVNTQQLMEESQGLVRSLAWKVRRQLPDQVDIDDLISDGQVGLAQAAREFDPSRGVKFSTFAYYRIRGAIYDGLSKTTWLKRSRHSEATYDRWANEVLRENAEGSDATADSGRPATTQWLNDITGKLAVVYLMSQQPAAEEGESPDVADDSAPTPATAASDAEIEQKLNEFVAELPQEMADLIRGVYFEGLTLQQAGERQGISKSWASRLHARALEMLARSLKSIGADD